MSRNSILDYFIENAEQYGTRTAALVKREGVYRDVTWSEMHQESRLIASGLVDLGVEPGARICLISQTRLEWVTIDMGILAAGAVTVPIYPSNLPDECQFIVENSGSVVVFAEDDTQVQKFRAERSRLPGLKKIIQISGQVAESDDDWVVSLDSLKKSTNVNAAVLQERRRSLDKDSILTIIYTSGTTGRPKGVVTTHDAMLYEAEAIAQIDLIRDSDLQLLFLPLAHSFAKVLEIAWLAQRHIMAFAESMNTIKQNLAEVRPTVMAGVPRIYEKFFSAVVQKGTSKGGAASHLFKRAMVLSQKNGEAQERGRLLSLQERLEFAVLKRLVFQKVGKGLREILGGRMRTLVSGGAPLSRTIAWFFRDAGLDILEGYGLTETSAATCVNRPGRVRIGTVGLPLPGSDIKIASDGEILIRGRGVMREYWQNPEATAEVLRDGWFYTGDIGVVDSDGHVRIVDRKKDIIVTAGGKNVAPQNIENVLKTHRLISQAVVHGDQRNFLSALITLDAEALQHFAEVQGLGKGSYAQLTQKPEVYKEIDSALKEFNKHLPSYETIKKFKILEHDFSQETGELTASLKIKRKVINQRYKNIFDNFYSDIFAGTHKDTP